MNLIIIGKRRTLNWTLDKARPTVVFGLAFGALALIALPAFAGYVASSYLNDPRKLVMDDVRQLQSELLLQKQELDAAQAASEQHMDALAMQLAELQAHAARLNALGDRLTKMGKLDDGEFDFSELPSLGGPEEPISAAGVSDPEFAESLNQIRETFSAQAEQLTLLESLLLDRDLDRSLLPAGVPVRSGYISSSFGHRNDPFTGRRTMHSGVDFSAPSGTEILAVAGGVVTWSGTRPGYGNIVEIDHGNGYKTRYAHNSAHEVEVGDRVHAGMVIAKMGATGRATGSHVHFEVWFDDRPVNPMEFIRTMREQG